MLQFAQGLGVEGSKAADVPEAEGYRQGERQKEPEAPAPDIADNDVAEHPEQIQNAEEAVQYPCAAHDDCEGTLPDKRGQLAERQAAKQDCRYLR